MKKIRLSGKYAVGEHQFAIVDDDMFDELNRYKWKAKPNGDKNNVYAIRTQKIEGKTKDIRMHRVVVGVEYDGIHDIDHINRNSLDNRRINIRLCTRSVNVKNTDHDRSGNFPKQLKIYLCLPHTCQVKFGECPICDKPFVNKTGRQTYCSDRCRFKSRHHKHSKLYRDIACNQCGEIFKQKRIDQRFCSEQCRHDSWNEQRRVG